MNSLTETQTVTTATLVDQLRAGGHTDPFAWLTGALSVFVTQENLNTISGVIENYYPAKESK